jgi:hypothetical protein
MNNIIITFFINIDPHIISNQIGEYNDREHDLHFLQYTQQTQKTKDHYKNRKVIAILHDY